MRKLMLVLVVLVATPAFALDFALVPQGDCTTDCNVVVMYSDADPCNLPRAFALDITVNKTAMIEAVIPYKTDGESTQASPGYGIYPSGIVIDANGNPITYGSPESDPNDPGGYATPGQRVVVELGSLYTPLGYGSPNAPDVNGILCTIVVDCNGSTDVNIVMQDEDAFRAGVILEDGTPDEGDANTVVCAAPEDCFPSGPGYAQQYADWLALGKPNCWCSEDSIPGDTGPEDGSYFQCDGDSRDDGQIIDWRVYSNDLADLIASWKARTGDPHLNPCADFTHDGQIIDWRVYSNDLARLILNWKKTSLQLPGDCPRPDATK